MSNCYVEVGGGLGNQLFQIATGFAYSKDTNKNLVISDSGWTASQGSSPRNYADTIFQDFKFEDTPITRDIIGISEKREMIYEELPSYPGSVKLNGYFQSPRYFEKYWDIFKDELVLPEIKTDYIKDHSIAFHIRRGDYARFQHIFGNVFAYFHKLFEKFKGEDIHVYTDSPEEVLREFEAYDFRIIQQSSDLKDLTALTLYDRIVCSNSSFSWWGAMLGVATEIIVPDKWILTVENPNIYTARMTKYEF